MVGRPTQVAKSGRKALTVGREWSVGPPGRPGVVKRPSWRAGMVGRLTGRTGRGWEALPVSHEW